ncbi:MAG: hypothetical protein JXB36_09305 [Gammaproteobacteria bacterium]|nr:hypothetical protein [Gammaproteobacteria bacterium]
MTTHRTRTRTFEGADQGEPEQRARARTNAWLLALLVLAFYLGFIGIGVMKSMGA